MVARKVTLREVTSNGTAGCTWQTDDTRPARVFTWGGPGTGISEPSRRWIGGRTFNRASDAARYIREVVAPWCPCGTEVAEHTVILVREIDGEITASNRHVCADHIGSYTDAERLSWFNAGTTVLSCTITGRCAVLAGAR
jgi:hypothetical protein